MLVVGFYLINVGYEALALRFGVAAATVQEGLETLSRKIGLVLLVLGAMHFFNLALFATCRRRALYRPAPATASLPPTLMMG